MKKAFLYWWLLFFPTWCLATLQPGDLVQTNVKCDLYSGTAVVGELPAGLQYKVAAVSGNWVSLTNLDGSQVKGWTDASHLVKVLGSSAYDKVGLLFDSGKALPQNAIPTNGVAKLSRYNQGAVSPVPGRMVFAQTGNPGTGTTKVISYIVTNDNLTDGQAVSMLTACSRIVPPFYEDSAKNALKSFSSYDGIRLVTYDVSGNPNAVYSAEETFWREASDPTTGKPVIVAQTDMIDPGTNVDGINFEPIYRSAISYFTADSIVPVDPEPIPLGMLASCNGLFSPKATFVKALPYQTPQSGGAGSNGENCQYTLVFGATLEFAFDCVFPTDGGGTLEIVGGGDGS